jgi:hypothetical protein
MASFYLILRYCQVEYWAVKQLGMIVPWNADFPVADKQMSGILA